MTSTSPPSTGDTGWGTTLNDYLVNDLQADITTNTTNLSNHAANSPADPHGDRAYALGLVSPIMNNINQASGYVQLGSDGSLDISTLGAGLKVAEGTNAKQGTGTLVAGTVTISNSSVTSTSRIFLTTQDPGNGTPGALYVAARTAGTSFTVTSTSDTDTSTFAYEIFEQG